MDTTQLPPAIMLMGPTASGKTDLAIYLAQHIDVEVISVDSALIYRDMNIGTAKPTQEELALAPHRLINICDPAESYSVARFRREALAEMADITQSGKIPLLVGGTMLYYRALQFGLSPMPQSKPEIRQDLEAQRIELGMPAMHAKLAEVDTIAAKRLHPNDQQRVLRALEVWMITGRTLTELQAAPGETMPYRAIKLVRCPEDRAVLHDRINRRFDMMVEQGFDKEVSKLMARGDLILDMPSMRSVGYRQMWQHLQGDFDKQEMLEKGKAATRQLAKRQITWLRSEENCHWLDGNNDLVNQRALQYIRKTL